MLNNMRSRARRDGVAATITREWVLKRLEDGTCEITGLSFVLSVGHGRGHARSAFSPSLDRRDAGGDYSPENCRLVCWIYNRARGAFPEDQFETMCRAYLLNKEEPC